MTPPPPPGPADRLAAALAGRYTIERQLGEGGMATVFLAEDLKHKRKVALKVLKPELAAVLGAERFVQEITTTASLQHPHILPLFDSGTADSFLYYVMPFVEGETLRDRLNRESQLPVDEAVRIAADVADALDYAHRHGVIHRDIKPENILLHDGRPVVADFGIALAVSAAAGGRMTETGLSLGTPHYMSPEQATAEKELTGRSDVYSLGCVLYELLTGDPPHVGATAQQIIMKIVTEDAAPVTKARKSVPPNISAALAKALEKLPADRFGSAAEFRDALRDPSFATATPATSGATAAASVGSRRTVVALGIVAVAAVIAAVWGWSRPSAPAPVVRYQLTLPDGQAPVAGTFAPTPLPDGSAIIYRGPVPGTAGAQLWIKRRDSHSATPVAGTVGAQSFAVSPDGQQIVFVAAQQLRTISIQGGASVILVPSNVGPQLGLAWLDDGTVVYATNRAVPELRTVSSNGGEPSVLWRHATEGAVLPERLPGHRGVLFMRCTAAVAGACDLWAIRLVGDTGRRLLTGTESAQYAPTGHLVFVQQGRLLAVEFDADRLETRGAPVALADSVATAALNPAVRLSPSGTLVLQRGSTPIGGSHQMVWVDRTGRESPVDTAWKFELTRNASNHGWALSPDGRQLAIGLFTEAGDDIWVKQLPRGALSRVSFGANPDYRPRWTPDGRSVTFISSKVPRGMYARRADAAGEDSLIVEGPFDEAGYTPDGNWIVFRQGAAGSVAGGRDVFGMQVGRDTAPIPVLVTPYDEDAVAVSPDGKWMAYQSDETGRKEIFIRSFPNTALHKRQVSNGGGNGPLWSRDGRELFYVSTEKQMMAVRVSPGSPITVGDPVALFRVPDELLAVESLFYTPWDIAPDGRFIMARLRPDVNTTPRFVVAENWLEELKARMGR